jgi:hypothetical protein
MQVLMTIPVAPPPVLKDQAKWSPLFHSFLSACVPEDHEILTDRGFMDLDAYKAAVVPTRPCWSPATTSARRALTFERPHRAHRERAALARHGGARVVGDFTVGVDMLVTVNHDLYVEQRASSLSRWPPPIFSSRRQQRRQRAPDGGAPCGWAGSAQPSERRRTVAVRRDGRRLIAAADAADAAAAERRRGALSRAVWLLAGVRLDRRAARLRDVSGGRGDDAAWLERRSSTLLGARGWAVDDSRAHRQCSRRDGTRCLSAEYGHLFDAAAPCGAPPRLRRGVELGRLVHAARERRQVVRTVGVVARPCGGAQHSEPACDARAARAASSCRATIVTSSARFRDELVRLCMAAGFGARFRCVAAAAAVGGALQRRERRACCRPCPRRAARCARASFRAACGASACRAASFGRVAP